MIMNLYFFPGCEFLLSLLLMFVTLLNLKAWVAKCGIERKIVVVRLYLNAVVLGMRLPLHSFIFVQ